MNVKLFPEHWKTDSVSALCTDVVDCVNKTAPVVDGPTEYKMIRTTNVKAGRINLDDCRYVDEATFVKWTRRIQPKRDDIVLTREAPLGEVGLLRSDESVFLGQRTMLYRANPKKLDQRFLYYSMLGPFVQGQIRSQGSGATVEHLRVPDAESFLVAYPPLEEQRRIAALLSAYDDLIANNQRRIALLESMAEEIYREWFVRLRFPGADRASFEKGLPVGWQRRNLREIAEVDPLERRRTGEPAPFAPMDQLSTQSMYFEADETRSDWVGAKFRNHDVLLPRITPSLENGKRGYVLCLKDDEVGVGSTEFIVLRATKIAPEHLYFLSISDGFRKHAELSMSGASGRQRVQDDCFNFFLVAVPPPDVTEAFVQVVRPMFKQVFNLAEQNKRLSAQRDALLPRLISGKLRVEALDIQFPPSMQQQPAEVAPREAIAR